MGSPVELGLLGSGVMQVGRVIPNAPQKTPEDRTAAG
jgi:hypothetical protein